MLILALAPWLSQRPPPADAAKPRRYLVSLGDSYATLDDGLTTVAPYGLIPVPVATVCRISYYCDFRDIHARTNGYRLIAKLVVKLLPKRTHPHHQHHHG